MRCLNLKITYNCTNQCSFCFSSYLKNIEIPFEKLKEAVIKGYDNGCRELVLSGGEPTLYPYNIIELLNLAENLGYSKYIIQTNGYGLSNNERLVSFLKRVAKTKEICISFSVHGHIADIHNELCGNLDAFELLIDALENIKNTPCSIYTNTVINTRNIKHLKDISLLLKQYSPKIMQFSMMHLKEKNELTVSLSEAVMEIRHISELVGTDVLKTEGIPYCLMHKMEYCVSESSWPAVLDIYNNVDKYIQDFKPLNYGMRKKLITCGRCIMDKICMGVWKEHFEEFSNMNIHPIEYQG